MATREQYAETVAMTVVFFLILFGVLLLQRQYGGQSGVTVGPSVIALGLIPFLFFLVATGRLKQFGGAGFEVVLRRQAHRTIAGVGDEKIEIAGGKAEVREVREKLRTGVRTTQPTTLAFDIEREGFYRRDVIEEYLTVLSDTLDYVLFIDSSESFEGYMDVTDFERLLGGTTDLVTEIETGSILARPTVNTGAIPADASNKAALEEMNRLGVDGVALLDPNGQFVGVVTQDQIVRTLLTNAIQEV